MMESPLVHVVILAWNQKRDTLEALDSVLAMAYPNLRVVVADNGSTDGTADDVRARNESVEVVRTERNLGIAGGYNLGIAHALRQGADYVLVMNNDVEVAPDMLSQLVSEARRNPDVGALMPKIYHYYGERTRLWNAGARWRRFPPGVKLIGINARDGPRWNQVREIPYVTSCALLLSREALERTGGFDPQYYFYQSDWDFSARLRENGLRILYVPQAHMWHKVSVSSLKGDRPARYWFTMGSGSVAFYLRHASALVLVTFAVWFTVRETLKLKWGRIAPFWAGFVYGLGRHWHWTD